MKTIGTGKRSQMKGFLILAIALLEVVMLLAGCGATSREIQRLSESTKADIFAEIKEGETVPKGSAELRIKASIKTHLEGYYIGESKESLHGKPVYPFLLNIDGQGIVWNIEGVNDNKPKYYMDAKTSRDPEAGEGMKYFLEKKLRLAVGAHRVFFGLPEDNYSTELEISLKDGETYTLEFKPVYRSKRIPTRIPTFLKGIKKYEIYLNGKQLFLKNP